MSRVRFRSGARFERAKSKREKTMPWHWYECQLCGRQCSKEGYGRDGVRRCPAWSGSHRPGKGESRPEQLPLPPQAG